MRENSAQQRKWLGYGRVGRLWHIRPEPHILNEVARRAGVKTRYVPGGTQGISTGGTSSPRHYYAADDALRVAPDIVAGRIEVDPTWRTDTPEGRRIHYRRRLKGFLIVTAFLSPLIAVPVVLVIRLWL